MKTKISGLIAALVLTLAASFNAFGQSNTPAGEQSTVAVLPKGAIPPPNPESGQNKWSEYLTVYQVDVLNLIKPTATFDQPWVGVLQAHLTALVTEPQIYADWDHTQWLRILSAYGILGDGNTWDPLRDKAAQIAYAKAAAKTPDGKVSWDAALKEGIFKEIQQKETVRNLRVQDAFLEWAKPQTEQMFKSMPKSHRDGYLAMAHRVIEVISTEGWYEKEKAYLGGLQARGNDHDFVMKSPDGKDDPFRKIIAFLFRRVRDGTLTEARSAELVARVTTWIDAVEADIKQSKGYVHGVDQFVHQP